MYEQSDGNEVDNMLINDNLGRFMKIIYVYIYIYIYIYIYSELYLLSWLMKKKELQVIYNEKVKFMISKEHMVRDFDVLFPC